MRLTKRALIPVYLQVEHCSPGKARWRLRGYEHGCIQLAERHVAFRRTLRADNARRDAAPQRTRLASDSEICTHPVERSRHRHVECRPQCDAAQRRHHAGEFGVGMIASQVTAAWIGPGDAREIVFVLAPRVGGENRPAEVLDAFLAQVGRDARMPGGAL